MQAIDKTLMQTAAATASNVATELSHTMEEASRLGKAATRLADQKVRENPWRVIGVVAAAAFLFGLLKRRD